jgi:hypothetical protein
MAVSLYLIAAACGGDNAATITATPVSTNGASAAASTATSSPATSSGALANTPTATGERVVEEIDSGYSAERGGISGGVILYNRNKNEAVAISYSVEITIGGVSQTVANGTVVLLPAQTLGDAFNANYAPADATIESFKINVNLPNARWLASSLSGRFGVTVASTEPRFVHGAVANPFDHESGRLWLSVLAYNDAGKIIGGSNSGVTSIPAHGSANFDAVVPYVQNGANTTRIETYVSFQNDFPDWMKTP